MTKYMMYLFKNKFVPPEQYHHPVTSYTNEMIHIVIFNTRKLDPKMMDTFLEIFSKAVVQKYIILIIFKASIHIICNFIISKE